MSTKRIALTGGPGTGKTSLINELERLGYPCSHEYSRQIIRESLATGSDVTPWDNLDEFSHRVMEGRILQHQEASGFIHFFDRTIIDTIAYQEADKLAVKPEWAKAAEMFRFDHEVFITPPWPEIFQREEERQESVEQLQHIHDHLVSAYQKYGYKIIEVPKISVEERIKWILERVEDK